MTKPSATRSPAGGPTTAPQVRVATGADRPAVEALLSAVDLPRAGVGEILAEHPEDFVLAEAEGALLAVAGLEVRGEDALLRSVAVRPDRRDLGLGGLLVRRLLSDAERRGLHALYLLTTTAEDYFPRFGFARVERADVPREIRATEEFASACPASAVVMERRLSGSRGAGSKS